MIVTIDAKLEVHRLCICLNSPIYTREQQANNPSVQSDVIRRDTYRTSDIIHQQSYVIPGTNGTRATQRPTKTLRLQPDSQGALHEECRMCRSEARPPWAGTVDRQSPVDVSLDATPLRECWACVGDGALHARDGRIPKCKDQSRLVGGT